MNHLLDLAAYRNAARPYPRTLRTTFTFVAMLVLTALYIAGVDSLSTVIDAFHTGKAVTLVCVEYVTAWLLTVLLNKFMGWVARYTTTRLWQHPDECCTPEIVHQQQGSHALVCWHHRGFRMAAGILFVKRDALVFVPLQRPRCMQPLRYCIDAHTRVFMDDSGYSRLFRIVFRQPPPRVCVRAQEAAFSFYVPQPDVVCAKLNELLAANRAEGTQGE